MSENYISLGSFLMVLSRQNTFILGKSLIVWETCSPSLATKEEIPTLIFSSLLKQTIRTAQDKLTFSNLNFSVCENDVAMAVDAAKQYEDEVNRKR